MTRMIRARGLVRRLVGHAKGLRPRARPVGSFEPTRVLFLSEEPIGVERLVWLVNQHPGIRVDPAELGVARDGASSQQAQLFREALSARDQSGLSVVGLKTGIKGVLDLAQIQIVVRDLQPLIVHVVHENVVRTTLFREAVNRSQAWLEDWRQANAHHDTCPPPLRGDPLPFDGQRFTLILREAEIQQARLRRFVDKLGLGVHRLTETEILLDERAAVAGVLRYVGLDPSDEVAHPPQRGADERYLDVFEDAQALYSHLEETPYGSMLEALRSEHGGPDRAPIAR